MNLLIKSIRIIDPTGSVNDQGTDIYIEDGIYKNITGSILPGECRRDTIIFNGAGKYISIGWFDMRVNFREPGYEQKETIASGQQAAAAGGFTGVAIMPSVNPVIQTRADIEFVIAKSKNAITEVYPIGSLTVNREGKELTEMYDMQLGGAVAFSDDDRFLADSGAMLRAMQYAKQINSRVISFCDDKGLSCSNSVNESLNTTMLGMKGSPAIAEEIGLERDLALCRYSGASIHVAGVSTRNAIEIIRKAKQEGLPVTCEANVYHLMLDDGTLIDFNTNYKVKPPLRSTDDCKALCEAVFDNTVDVIVSNHSPQDVESKNIEWDFASYGMIGLESFFGVLNGAIDGKVKIGELVKKITVNPRKILGIKIPSIKEGEKINFTIFDPDAEWTFEEKNIRSLSHNTPFIGKKLRGKVIAIANNGIFETIL